MKLRSLALPLFLAIALSGCLRARLLHPPSSTDNTRLGGAVSEPTVAAAGGILHGHGVTLQASFGLASPSQPTGHGVRLQVGR